MGTFDKGGTNMKYIKISIYIFLLAVFVICSASFLYAGADVPLINKDELKTMLDDPNVIVLDVRRGKDWTSSEFKIKGATYHEPGDYESWSRMYSKNQKIVLYCA
jgi:hypothetical protein